ncbi:transcriptional regulator [Rhodoferax lacus]|uniref:Transcriptional regulator n=1 Tax=Rhodoferax lacus TaxID=2184758 RepID=A0A3E1RGQ4_9BURK|nr:YafY family protein [Rhodoferax lacus]RFO97780.1 transcriptional regulator [Rhodoferax lacus]
MSEVVRLYRYKSLLGSRTAVSANELMAALEVSRATLKRDIAKLRDQLHVPIRFDRDLGGYLLEDAHTDNELPGLWFSQEEILALVTIQQLLEQLEPGLLGNKLKPLQSRLNQLMDKHGLASQDVAKRIRIVHAGKRVVQAKSFEVVAAATMARKRLKIWHFNRQNGITTERQVSPQRLVHYRDNWYLDAWCHLRDDVRSFSIDAIQKIEVLDTAAKEVSTKNIDQALGSGYGIFNGAAQDWAKLRFTPERARWVAGESWHPLQESSFEADGSYLLSFPYADDRELVGDIMRFGADVQVLEPKGLRSKVQKGFLEAVGKYV